MPKCWPQMDLETYQKNNQKAQILNIYSRTKNEETLYSSQVFCGDCSMSEQNQFYSGARPIKWINEDKYPQMKYQKGILRSKPGRIDLPKEKRSHILSCSDKISLCNILGIQGRQLFAYIQPIYFQLIIVDSVFKMQHNIEQGIDMIGRISLIKNKSKQQIINNIFYIDIDNKKKRISYQFIPNKPKLVLFQKQKKQDKQTLDLCCIITKQKAQWINGKTGLPQGCSLNNYKKQNKTSEFCLRKLSQNLQQKQQQQFKYDYILQKIKQQFTEWL